MKIVFIIVIFTFAGVAQAGSDVGGDIKTNASLSGGQVAIATGAAATAENFIASIDDSKIGGSVSISATVNGGQVATSTGIGSRATDSVASLH
jgi:hypothetical protein